MSSIDEDIFKALFPVFYSSHRRETQNLLFFTCRLQTKRRIYCS